MTSEISWKHFERSRHFVSSRVVSFLKLISTIVWFNDSYLLHLSIYLYIFRRRLKLIFFIWPNDDCWTGESYYEIFSSMRSNEIFDSLYFKIDVLFRSSFVPGDYITFKNYINTVNLTSTRTISFFSRSSCFTHWRIGCIQFDIWNEWSWRHIWPDKNDQYLIYSCRFLISLMIALSDLEPNRYRIVGVSRFGHIEI